jgi:hypothetical protein
MDMNRHYKTIIYYCIALVVLFLILLLMPRDWETKSGMSQRDYDKAISKAQDSVLKADTPRERQVALRQVKGLKDYQKAGRIAEVRDMRWALNILRYVLIVAILSLCWVIIRLVIKEIRRQNMAKGKAVNNSATGG